VYDRRSVFVIGILIEVGAHADYGHPFLGLFILDETEAFSDRGFAGPMLGGE